MSRSVIYYKLAAIYDQVMNHVDYRGWSDYVAWLLCFAGVQPKKIVDLSCGTGSFLKYFLRENMFGIGGDFSIDMIRQAKKKTYRSSCGFLVSDMSVIALRNECCDAVILLYDSINYLTSVTELKVFFEEIQRILDPEGVLIFDSVTEKHCLDHKRQLNEAVYWDRKGYEKMSHYDKRSRTQYTDFKILIDNEYFHERHIQKIYEINELSKMVKAAGFDYHLFDGFTHRPIHRLSKRVHFLCSRIR